MAVSFRKCTMQKCASLPSAGSVDRIIPCPKQLIRFLAGRSTSFLPSAPYCSLSRREPKVGAVRQEVPPVALSGFLPKSQRRTGAVERERGILQFRPRLKSSHPSSNPHLFLLADGALIRRFKGF